MNPAAQPTGPTPTRWNHPPALRREFPLLTGTVRAPRTV